LVPADQLLVFQVGEGWERLCKFLGKPVPAEEFPRENVGGTKEHFFSQFQGCIFSQKIIVLPPVLKILFSPVVYIYI